MTALGLILLAGLIVGYPFHRRAVAAAHRDLAPVVEIGGRG